MFKFSEQVRLELVEMKRLGMQVPPKAFTQCDDAESMLEYENMGVSECADLLIALA